MSALPSNHIRGSRRDPRTIARDVPGLFEAAFPRLLPGIVVHLNKAKSYNNDGCVAVSEELIGQSSLQHAMLFEIALAVCEARLRGIEEIRWADCLDAATRRQQRFYDAKIPNGLEEIDQIVSEKVADNLQRMLGRISKSAALPVIIEPSVKGFKWIESGVGDFAVGNTIIEVKCTSNLFNSADYRQLLIYWLLSYLDALERNGRAWERGILLNPRLNFAVETDFNELISLVSGGLSKIEVAQSFAAMMLGVSE